MYGKLAGRMFRDPVRAWLLLEPKPENRL